MDILTTEILHNTMGENDKCQENFIEYIQCPFPYSFVFTSFFLIASTCL